MAVVENGVTYSTGSLSQTRARMRTAAAEESKVKEKPAKQKKVKPPVDFRSVKSGFVDKQGEVYSWS